MKKYRFGLANVLRIRQLQEEQARSAMQSAQREFEEATKELDRRLAAIGTARPMLTRHTLPEFQYQRDQLERHALAVAAARSAEANALAELLIARRDWEESAKAVKALERLDERKRETWVLETTRAAQAATDEIAQTHFRKAGQ